MGAACSRAGAPPYVLVELPDDFAHRDSDAVAALESVGEDACGPWVRAEVMARHSPVVQAGLQWGFAELKEGVVHFPDTALSVVQAFVELCATGEALVLHSELFPLFEFCHRQQQEAAMDAVLRALFPKLGQRDPSAAIYAYLLGDTYCPHMRAAAVELLRQRPEAALRGALVAEGGRLLQGLTGPQLREVLSATGPLVDPELLYAVLACWVAELPAEEREGMGGSPWCTYVPWDLLPASSKRRIALRDAFSRVPLMPPDVALATVRTTTTALLRASLLVVGGVGVGCVAVLWGRAAWYAVVRWWAALVLRLAEWRLEEALDPGER
eukprot:GGOE01037083.1.p1 GENE.GGOE01037083.1~~GGOE01037083.1.p1  ORF type:complete len:326 (+),score=76.78 GGOE01037083.1:42-1019(+)